jgi:predicted NAD/FAD-binding protein
MSFSVRCEKTGLEYRPSSLDQLFAQRTNLLRPWFWRMVRDIFRFRRESMELLQMEERLTLGEYLERKGYSRGFMDYFIIPMGAAIWSADPGRFRDFPARYFAEFFANHGFLKARGQPRWKVVEGGSRTYVQAMTRGFADRIRTNCSVRSVSRRPDGVEVKAGNAPAERFDQVVIAAHSDQALAMLEEPTPAEREILGALPYQENRTVLHTEPSLLPKREKVWASWNYLVPAEPMARAAVTYYMNMLQGLEAPEAFCVTLNQEERIPSRRVLRAMTYHHPVYTLAGRAAQKRHHEISGQDRIHYCGAYWGYGFHEDGVKSALEVCKSFGETL